MDRTNFPTSEQQQQHQQGQVYYPQLNQPLPHTMPPPTAAPWNIDSMPWKLASVGNQADGVMQFSAEKLAGSIKAKRTQLHQKRKGDVIVPLPSKQFISEEKITAHFNGLHISSDYIQNTGSGSCSVSMGADDDVPTTSGKCFTNLTYYDYQVTAKELEEKLRNASRITVCEDLKKLHEEHKKASFMPEALLNRIEKPCTALVLWQPPPMLELLQNKPNLDKMLKKPDADRLEDYTEDNNSRMQDVEIDDLIDNNNTYRLDFNNLNADGMDEDL